MDIKIRIKKRNEKQYKKFKIYQEIKLFSATKWKI